MENLKEYLHYNEITGLFTQIKDTGNGIKVPRLAGTVNNGYKVIKFKKKRYLAHRLAWYYVYGEFPTSMIDHRDGNKLNNSIDNLRLATNSENQQNQTKTQKKNKTGLLGVYKSNLKRNEKNPYKASIKLKNNVAYLGSFPTAELAHEAYINKKRELHPFCTI